MKNQHKYLNFTFFILLSLLLLLFYFNISIVYADNSTYSMEIKIVFNQVYSIIKVFKSCYEEELAPPHYIKAVELLEAKRSSALNIFDSVESFDKLNKEQLTSLGCLFEDMAQGVDYFSKVNYKFVKSFMDEVYDQLLLRKDTITLRLREID